jgi:site-specific recombinase XerD
MIERWLDTRSRLCLGGRHSVFCTLRGHPMADAYVRVMLKGLAVRVGIDTGQSHYNS